METKEQCKNFFKDIFERIGNMTLHEKRVLFCQLAPKEISKNLSFVEMIEYTTVIEFLKFEKEFEERK